MRKKQYRCVIFDVSGTIVQKHPTMAERVDGMLNHLRVPHSLNDVERMVANCEYELGSRAHLEKEQADDRLFMARMLAAQCSRLWSDKVHPASAARQIAEPAEAYSLAPGVWKVLSSLKCQGIKLGFAGQGTTALRFALEEMELISFADCMMLRDKADTGSQSILQLCEQCDVLPEETLYVCDHPADVKRAHAAGVDAAWMPSNLWFRLPDDSADYLLNDFSELLNLIV